MLRMCLRWRRSQQFSKNCRIRCARWSNWTPSPDCDGANLSGCGGKTWDFGRSRVTCSQMSCCNGGGCAEDGRVPKGCSVGCTTRRITVPVEAALPVHRLGRPGVRLTAQERQAAPRRRKLQVKLAARLAGSTVKSSPRLGNQPDCVTPPTPFRVKSLSAKGAVNVAPASAYERFSCRWRLTRVILRRKEDKE